MKIFGWDIMVSNKDNYEYNPIYIHGFIIYATLFKINWFNSAGHK